MSERDRLTLLLHELRAPVAALARLSEAAPAARENGRLAPLLALGVAAGRDVERILRDPAGGGGAREVVSLSDLATAAAALDGEGRVEVRLEAEPRVEVDPTRIRQLLANLVANGLRHGERVLVVVRSSQGWAVLDVADDGPGVAPGLDPFARGASGAGSTGLGLWLARAVAIEHGGRLELQEAGPLPGACFRLALPLASGGG